VRRVFSQGGSIVVSLHSSIHAPIVCSIYIILHDGTELAVATRALNHCSISTKT